MSDGIIHIHDDGQFNLDRANLLLAGVEKGVWKAAHSAIVRASQRAKTEAGRFAAEEYTISKGGFMNRVNVKTKLGGNSSGVQSVNVIFAGTVIPLLEFKTSYGRDGGINVAVKRGGGGTLAHAFVANIGGTGIFERVGPARFPVERKYGPSSAHMMQNESVIERMDEVITKTFNERIEHEITRVLNGWGG